jgi:transcriptional repressor NrdR
MLCPFCREKDSSVVDSRPTEDGTAIRRRRLSTCCNQRYTSLERDQFREMTVIKNNGRKSVFDRDKLIKSVMISLRKRPVDQDTIEKFVSKIYRNLEDLGQNEVLSKTIGKYVMEGLKEIDPVAYVRFASVYTNFKEVKDFEDFVGNLNVYKHK